jgi:hypothetical protein
MPTARGRLAFLLALLCAACGPDRDAAANGAGVAAGLAGPARHEVRLCAGRLAAVFRDNARSPGLVSGIALLENRHEAPGINAFDASIPPASTGLNFEHVTSGHVTPDALFSPRHGPYSLRPLADGRSVVFERRAEDSPWGLASTTRVSLVAPHALDIEFRCRAQDAARFGEHGWALLFWANYMRSAPELALHFPGVVAPDPADLDEARETWIPAFAPNVHPRWAGGGTYRALRAAPLDYDERHPAELVLWSYDVPRITRPLFYGLAPDGMALIVMFDRLWSPEDEIRFSLFCFKDDLPPPPARDFQYVIRHIESGREYGYRARMIWKRFVSEADCLVEYERWLAALQRVSEPAPGAR